MFAAWRTTSAKECELCRSIERKKLHVQQINGHDDLFFIVHMAVQQPDQFVSLGVGFANHLGCRFFLCKTAQIAIQLFQTGLQYPVILLKKIEANG